MTDRLRSLHVLIACETSGVARCVLAAEKMKEALIGVRAALVPYGIPEDSESIKGIDAAIAAYENGEG